MDKLQTRGLSLRGLIRLARPVNGLIAFISVFLGAYLAQGSINSLINITIVAFAAFLLLSGGNAFNDFRDIETDSINKPSRPIPSGQVSRRTALVFAIVLFVIGTGLGLFVNWMAFSVACSVFALLVLYTLRLRQFLLVGNIVIGLLTGLTFISGGIAVGTIGGAVIPAIFAFLFTAGREIVKDIQDMKGDDVSGLSSLPLRWGQRRAMHVSLIFLFLVIFISPWPYFLHIYSLYYLICVAAGVDLVLIYCIVILVTRLSGKNVVRVANLMKFDMFVGLGAVYLGRIGL